MSGCHPERSRRSAVEKPSTVGGRQSTENQTSHILHPTSQKTRRKTLNQKLETNNQRSRGCRNYQAKNPKHIPITVHLKNGSENYRTGNGIA